MNGPTTNYRAGRLMCRQESGAKIESSLSAAETTGRRISQGKNFDCSRGCGRVTTADCLPRYEAQEAPCYDDRGPCAIGFVAQQRAAGRL